MTERAPSILALSPGSMLPPRSGDARRVLGISDALEDFGFRCTTVVKNAVRNPSREVRWLEPFPSYRRTTAGLLAWWRRGHYNEVMHCTDAWWRQVASLAADPAYDLLYCHFLYTFPTLRNVVGQRPLVIDTHNSEWNWYQTLRSASRNPMAKAVCDYSCERATKIMHMLPPGTIMAHVSEFDASEYRRVRPDLTHLVVPNGASVPPRSRTPDYRDPRKKLLFIGGLAVKMSGDALNHFDKRFWPVLKDHAQVIIAGANPTPKIQSLAAARGWELRANLTEEQVDEAFSDAHFAILPFEYGAGSKLKFLEACGRGVPILSTPAGVCGQECIPGFAKISDDPQDWLNEILRRTSMEPDWRQQVEQMNAKISWPAIVEPFARHLKIALANRKEPARTLDAK